MKTPNTKNLAQTDYLRKKIGQKTRIFIIWMKDWLMNDILYEEFEKTKIVLEVFLQGCSTVLKKPIGKSRRPLSILVV